MEDKVNYYLKSLIKKIGTIILHLVNFTMFISQLKFDEFSMHNNKLKPYLGTLNASSLHSQRPGHSPKTNLGVGGSVILEGGFH